MGIAQDEGQLKGTREPGTAPSPTPVTAQALGGIQFENTGLERRLSFLRYNTGTTQCTLWGC